jgi:hypothetical protein
LNKNQPTGVPYLFLRLNLKTISDESKKTTGFIIDGDNGEKYYQIHLFESGDGRVIAKLSSKINPTGQIEARLQSFSDFPVKLTHRKPATKEEFDNGMKILIKAAEEAGLAHRFIDLSGCETFVEQLALLQKMEPRFKINIRER